MRNLLFIAAVSLLAAGCSDSTEPSVSTAITFSPGTVTLDAIGATQVVHANVTDQKGRAMKNAELVWTSNAPAVSVTGLGGDSAAVKGTANGTASVTAQSGSATASLEVRVAQVAASFERLSGNGQLGTVSLQLGAPLRVRVRDRLGVPLVGQTVNFTITLGNGTLSTNSATTDAEGIASVTLTLGPVVGTNSVTASIPGSSLAAVVFSSEAFGSVVANLFIVRGGFQATPKGTILPTTPTVAVRDAAGQGVPGIRVNFALTSGGGSLGTTTAVTDASGQAAAAGWRLGATADVNTVTVTALGITGGAVTLRGIGCGGGESAAGYNITLCISTEMTAPQRAAFVSAADRWASAITGDLAAASGEFPQGACGSNPSANFTYDDLVIFASAESIDGPGGVLGQAGPCALRVETGGLPIFGVMEFDVADLAKLEADNQLSNVIVHEMGHVLGIGTIWSRFGLLQDPSSQQATLDTYYSGAAGRAGFDAVGGATYTGGQKVPVENTGGPGTRNGHWRESVLRNELMTGFINAGSNPLSVLTIRSLSDLGYVVNPGAADPFFLTLTFQGDVGGKLLQLHDDVYEGPRFTFGPRGELAPIP